MKNAPQTGAGRGAETDVRGADSPASPPFRLLRCEPCEFGSKRAQATIAIDGLGEMDVDFFAPVGKATFATAASVRSRYTGAYERVVRLDKAFAAEVRAAIEQRLGFGRRMSAAELLNDADGSQVTS